MLHRSRLSGSRRHFASRTATKAVAAAVAAGMALTLAACGDDAKNTGVTSQSDNPDERTGEEITTDGPEVIAAAKKTDLDIETSKRFFDEADTVVITSDDADAQAQGAEKAVEEHAPMLSVAGKDSSGSDSRDDAIAEELDRLGTATVITVGKVDSSGWDEHVDIEELAETTTEDASEDDDDSDDAADGDEADDGVDNENEDAADKADPVAAAAELEAEARIATPVFATEETGVAAVATARAAGAEVLVLPGADPRATKKSSELAQARPTIGLGEAFGNTDYYREASELAGRGELPGGGELVFPGRRMIALYGHPSGDALGLLGTNGPDAAVDYLNDLIEEYEQFTDQPVIPAFEIITTIAASEPGPDDNYTNTTDPEELIPYLDAIEEAGGYAVLDLQPGRAKFLDQAKIYEDLLKRPNVGLALDPEWRFDDGGKPLDRVGSMEASEVNEVSEWLAKLVRDNDLPQKALVLHQFQLQMLRDREQINTDHPELAMVLHADGHGTPNLKFETWDVMREDLDPRFFMAWKNFTKEDEPMFTPEQTYNDVNPRPWFVSYQ